MTTTNYTLTTNTATATYTVTGESPEISIAGDFGGGLAFVQVDLDDGLGWIDDASTNIARRFSVGVKPGSKLRVRLQDSDDADLDISIVDAASVLAQATTAATQATSAATEVGKVPRASTAMAGGDDFAWNAVVDTAGKLTLNITNEEA